MNKEHSFKKFRIKSLRVKWVTLTLTFIMGMFLIFSTFIYYNATQMMSSEGRKNIEMTIEDMVEQLSQSEKPLTTQRANQLLSKTVKISGPAENRTVDVGNLIAELGQDELYAYVYSANKQLIVETRPRKSYRSDPIVQNIHLGKVHGMLGFIVGKEVRSKKNDKIVGYVQLFYELDDLNHIRKDIVRNIEIFVIISLIVSFLGAILISHYFLSPLQKLVNTMKIMQEDPMTNERTPLPKDKNELWELTKSSNHMMDQVQRYIHQQEQFVEDVSHELRTPVAIIEGHLQMLNRWGKDDPEILSESLEASLQEIDRMKALVQEMLDLTRIDQEELQYQNETCVAHSLVQQVLNNFQILYPDFSFVLNDELLEPVEVCICHRHLEQLLVILIDNAVKYSTDKKVVHVTLSANTRHLEIAVQDFGEGISEEDLQKIFDRFYRVDKARSRQKGGNGLGLAIAQKLVEVYHGKLSVDSILDEGTVFHIELPIKKEK